MQTTKVCNRCQKDLPAGNFGQKKKRNGEYTLKSRCRACIREIHREKYNKRDRDRKKERETRAQRELERANSVIDDPTTRKKVCTACNQSLFLTDFHAGCKNPSRTWHWDHLCKKCKAADQRRRVKEGYQKPDRDLAGKIMDTKEKRIVSGLFRSGGQRRRKFELTTEEVRQLVKQQTKNSHLRCAVTGAILNNETNTGPMSPSLDRIDNSKDYILGNVRITSLMWNLGSNIWEDEESERALLQMADALRRKRRG